MRIFILLGSNKNSAGKKAILLGSSGDSVRKSLFLFGKSSRVWVVCHSTGELSEAVVRLVFGPQDNLLGNLDQLNGFRWGLIVGSFSSAGDL